MKVAVFDWAIGSVVVFILTVVMISVTPKHKLSFVVWLTIFTGFMVWSSMLDLSLLIIFLILMTVLVALKLSSSGNSDRLIGVMISIMGVLTFFSLLTGNSLIGSNTTAMGDSLITVDGVATTISYDPATEVFYIDPVLGFISLFVVFGSVAGIAGIQFLGSGLSDSAVRTVTWTIIYGSVWGLMSVLAIPLITGIALLGSIVYYIITFFYVFAVAKKLSG